MNWKNKNVLITGIHGFLGGHIAQALCKQGANVIGGFHDNKKASYCQLEKISNSITEAHIDILDLQRITDVLVFYEIEYVFHCAASAIVRTCSENPIGAFNNNIMGTVNVLEAARRSKHIKGILCMESDKSYGEFDDNDLPYNEEQSINPKNVYEVSKACSGLIAKAYSHNYDVPVFTVRAANLYGPGDLNVTRIIPNTVINILNDESPVLFRGVGNYVREFLYVGDMVYATIKLMENIDNTKSQIYNIGSGSIHPIHEIIELIKHYMGSNIPTNIVDKDATFKEIDTQYLDYNKLIKAVPDYNPQTFNNGIEKTVKWYKQYVSDNT